MFPFVKSLLPLAAAMALLSTQAWAQTPAPAAAAPAAAATTTPAQASAEYAEVNRLLRAGQYEQAVNRADQFLATSPKDPQMRFLKGVIQSQRGQTTEALTTFSGLTQDFPELPEPYNNLAVIYAGQNQLDKARVALEMAVRTNPSYSVAHENLGDVYARLAAQAYQKASQLDTTNTSAAPKLKTINGLFPNKGAKVGDAGGAATVAAMATLLERQPSAAGAPTASRDIESTVRAWAQAWSARDLSSYLRFYGAEFQAASGIARPQWERERESRIVPRERIHVAVSDLDIRADGKRATVRFRQDYESDILKVTDRKTLELVQDGPRWVIVRETLGSS